MSFKRSSGRARIGSDRKQRTFFQQSWWVIAITLLCAYVYFQAAQKKDLVIGSLEKQLNALVTEKRSLEDLHEDLRLQVNSQSDPAWIELTLKKGLGLVPEGERKVYFENHGTPL